jgi:hypothetical protein
MWVPYVSRDRKPLTKLQLRIRVRVIYRTAKSPCCGVPLGGVSTGCLDIDPTGTIGFCTIFSGYPREPKLFEPFLSLTVGDETWVLAAKQGFKPGSCENGKETRAGRVGQVAHICF